MGNQQAKSSINTVKQDQSLLLYKAKQIVNRIKLTDSDRQKRQQQHLLARMMAYGHGHLTDHLQKLPRQGQYNFIRYIRQIDIETMDLLYQNYIQKCMKMKRNKQKLFKYQKISYIDRKQTNIENHTLYQSGQFVLNTNKLAIVLFVGGDSTRFNTANSKYKYQKQVYTQQPNQKCLLQIKLDRISKFSNKYGQLLVYLIHNELNHHKINKIISKYTNIRFKKVLQNQNWIVTLSGKLCLKKHDDYYLLQAPSGCGDFINANIKGKRIIDDWKTQGISYVSCVGIENILDKVLDPYMVGLLHQQSKLGVVYKCTYPENENESAPRIIYNKNKQKIQIKSIQHFLQNNDQSSTQIIKRSPIWTNSCILKVSAIQSSMQQRLQRLSQIKQIQQIYTVRKVKKNYYNPIQQVYLDNQYCYIFERELSDFLMGSNLQMQAIMVQRQQQYMPVISIDQQMIWRDAYQQYQKKIKEYQGQQMMHKNINKQIPSFIRIESIKGDTDPHDLTKQTNEMNPKQKNDIEDSIISLDE